MQPGFQQTDATNPLLRWTYQTGNFWLPLEVFNLVFLNYDVSHIQDWSVFDIRLRRAHLPFITHRTVFRIPAVNVHRVHKLERWPHLGSKGDSCLDFHETKTPPIPGLLIRPKASNL